MTKHMDWELVVVWETGETDVFEYETEEKAEQGGKNVKMACGTQVQWYGTRRKYR